MKIKNLFLLLIVIMSSQFVLAQTKDSIELLNFYNNQYSNERDFKINYFNNPANMPDYSKQSFSSFKIQYLNDDRKIYRQQYGDKTRNFGVYASSYQKLKNSSSIWGAASYEKLNINNIKWNESLDFDRLNPYIVADSVGGTIDLEAYKFLGGYAKSFNKISLGIEGSYNAQLGYRGSDPRVKNVTSDFNLTFGLGYKFYKNLKIDAFVGVEKYIQNSELRFASLLGYPMVYQMTGFGNYNFIFSGGSSRNVLNYEELCINYAAKLSNKNGEDFYISIGGGNYNLDKYIPNTGESSNKLSNLNKEKFTIEGAKFARLDNHTLGLKLNYDFNKFIGYEYGYSSSSSQIVQIYKRKSYKRETENYGASVFYSYNTSNTILSVLPFFSYQTYSELRVGPFSGQKFKSNNYGLNFNITQKFNDTNLLNLKTYYTYKDVTSATNAISKTSKTSIDNWLQEDFNYMSSNQSIFGVGLQYNFKIKNSPIFFIEGNWQQIKIKSKDNNLTTLSVGINF